MLNCKTHDGSLINPFTHMGSEEMRIRLEILKKLQALKSGSSFVTDGIHVSPATIENWITYLQDYAIIQRWTTQKKYRMVFAEEGGQEKQHSMNSMMIFQNKVMITICETYLLNPYLGQKWHLASRVHEGQPVNGRPATRILEGDKGSIKLLYNFNTETLVLSGACTTEVPLLSAIGIPSPLGQRIKNDELKRLLFVHNNVVCYTI